jgi:endonuclease/exonuclease/phosphatase family metal-dependent hydrolase
MCLHIDSDVSAPDTSPSVTAPTGAYGIRLSATPNERDNTAAFDAARFATRADALAAIDAHPGIRAGQYQANYAVAWLGDGPEPETETEWSDIISASETITSKLTVVGVDVHGHFTNTRFPETPIDRVFSDRTLAEAKAHVLGEVARYRFASQQSRISGG